MTSASSPRRVPTNGITLSVTEVGDGPPVLLLHGFPDSARLWRHQIPVLVEAGYRVIAPDLRGFGDSDRPVPVEAYRMRSLIGDVTGLLDALDVPAAAVVGHDWGAALAWGLGMYAPQRVSRLTAVSVGHPVASVAAGRRQRELSWYMLWFLFPDVAERVMPRDDWRFLRQWGGGAPAGGDPADVERQIADLTRPGALTAALNWYRANIDPADYVAARADLPHVTCPTMGVWSSDDPFLGEEQMSASRAYIDAPWRYERLEGAGHWIPVELPERFSALLLDFLRG